MENIESNQPLKVQEVTPYDYLEEGKKRQIAKMFDRIAPSYDRINHIFSLGFDYYWRKKAIQLLKEDEVKNLLDVATGTGDFALSAVKRLPVEEIIGIDISKRMLQIGKKKILNKKQANKIKLQEGDVENMEFESNTFDAVTVAFGVRNFENLKTGISEMHRVLKTGKKVVILELGIPRSFLISGLYKIYFKGFLSKMAGWISRDRDAYKYLNSSVNAFPEKEAFTDLLSETGFKNCKWQALTSGICNLYSGTK